jgi:hypothetical protein
MSTAEDAIGGKYVTGAAIEPKPPVDDVSGAANNYYATVNAHAFNSLSYDSSKANAVSNYSYKYFWDGNEFGYLPSDAPIFVNIDETLSPIADVTGAALSQEDVISDGLVSYTVASTAVAIGDYPSGNLAKGLALAAPSVTFGVNRGITFYTADPEGGKLNALFNPLDITLSPFVSGSSANVTYHDTLNAYLTDTSDRKFFMAGGLRIENGTVYTNRSSVIGGKSGDPRQQSLENGPIENDEASASLIIDNAFLVFADPGEDETIRDSRIDAWEKSGAFFPTKIDNATVLVQNRHRLTVGKGVEITGMAGADKRVVTVESGGELVLDGATITGDIVVQNGAKLTIKSGTTITGDVHCAGALVLEGTGSWGFSLNAAASVADLSKHGIYLYNHTSVGVASLVVSGDPTISGTAAGKILSFVPLPDIADASNKIFSTPRDSGNNVTKAFDSSTSVWMKQGISD